MEPSEIAPEPPLPPFEVVVRQGEQTVVLEVHGDLCMRTAPDVAQRVGEAVARHPEELVIDLRGVEFMDSNGVRLLIETNERARSEGFSFGISLDGEQPTRVLELVGMTDWPRRVPVEDLP
jgi:anti-anti-sigma factor